MRNRSIGAATLIAATIGVAVLVLGSSVVKAENAVIDQCVNAQTGRLVSTSFCSCRVYWDTTHKEFRLRGGVTALCADHGTQTVGSFNHIGSPGGGLGGGNGGGLGGVGHGGGSGEGAGGGAQGGGGGLDEGGGPVAGNGGDDGGNSGLGNPGNDKDVGHAGEDPSGKGMGLTGSRGKNH